MKVGLFAASLLLSSALVSMAGAATITISPPDLSNKPAAKPAVPAPKAQPSIQTQAQPVPETKTVAAPKPAPRVVETKAKPAPVETKPMPAPRVVETKPKPEPKIVAAPPVPLPAPRVVETKPKPEPKVVAAPPVPMPVPRPQIQTAAKADCPCNCPKDSRRASHRVAHDQARGEDYRYAAAMPFEWRGHWRASPDDSVIQPSVREDQGLRIEDRGWNGGVGYAPEGGGGGGFVDGYGQVHFANGGSVENGPSYNSYGQSFQYNPSQAGPFQPRQMGGVAPGSR